MNGTDRLCDVRTADLSGRMQIRSNFWTNVLKWISLINTIVTLVKLSFILTLFTVTTQPDNDMNLLKYISIQNTLAA